MDRFELLINRFLSFVKFIYVNMKSCFRVMFSIIAIPFIVFQQLIVRGVSESIRLLIKYQDNDARFAVIQITQVK